jgi:hypothetical protein
MRPLINIGDRIHVKRAGAAEVRPKVVILFKSNDTFVTHRILKILHVNGKQVILQRGDAGGVQSTVSSEWVIGKVDAVEKGGRILALDKGRLGALNRFLGLKSGCTYKIDHFLFLLKRRLRDKPCFLCLRFFYRGIKWPFAILNRAVARLMMGG